jgi:hypothetical protein
VTRSLDPTGVGRARWMMRWSNDQNLWMSLGEAA